MRPRGERHMRLPDGTKRIVSEAGAVVRPASRVLSGCGATICSIRATLDWPHESLYGMVVRRILFLSNGKHVSADVGTRIAERLAWLRHMIDSKTINPMEAAR